MAKKRDGWQSGGMGAKMVARLLSSLGSNLRVKKYRGPPELVQHFRL